MVTLSSGTAAFSTSSLAAGEAGYFGTDPNQECVDD
jgi:hypothetical protein